MSFAGDYYRGRRVLVTGHTGFKGSWACLWLHRLGAQVTGYALEPPTQPSNFALSGVEKLLERHVIGDLRNAALLSETIKAARPEVIFHMAAQPLVRLSYDEPAATFEVNVMGTVNVLEAVRRAGAPCTVVVITSDKCYENREHVWGYRECDAMGGFDPYSASKGATELVVSSYRRSFFDPARVADHGVRLASGRAGNVIGGGDWARDRIVTDVVRTLAAGQPVPVRNPAAIRPWQHVLEPVSGYLRLAARMATSEDPKRWCDGWNFGPRPGDEATVKSLVEAFVAAWGSGSWQDLSDAKAHHEAKILRLSIDKAVSELNWRPTWTFAETVHHTARWYRRWVNGEASMAPACHDDIAAFEAASARASAS